MPGPEVWILVGQDGCTVKAVVGNLGFFQVQLHAFQAVQCASHISEVNAELPSRAEPNILPHLPRQ